MSALAYRNATLTKIAGGSTRRQYGKPQLAGAVKWTGSLGIAVVEKALAVAQQASGADYGDRVTEAVRTHLVIPNSAEVDVGDALTYTYRGQSVTRTASEVQRHDVLGAIRVYFEEA